VKAKYCEFHIPPVSLLGYIFQGGQVKTDPGKIKAVAEWPTPTNRKQLQRFLGFANFYRRFTHNSSVIASPLTRLTSVKSPFLLSSEAAQAFYLLKDRFTSAPILSQPNSDKQFILDVVARTLEGEQYCHKGLTLRAQCLGAHTKVIIVNENERNNEN